MGGKRGALLALVLGLAAVAPLGGAGGATPGAPQSLFLDPVGTFDDPTFLTAPPGDQDRLFVVQQGGVIKLVLDGAVQETPFLDASSWITGAIIPMDGGNSAMNAGGTRRYV